jgi:putative phosphoesterase
VRRAVLSDVHGTMAPLEAVLADFGDVDEIWVLGDLVALGPEPVEAFERLRSLPNARFTRGNTDRYVFSDEPLPSHFSPGSAETFAWTREQLGPERIAWLASLPLELRDRRILGVHAEPGRDDGDGITAEGELPDVDADLVLVGHTHRHVDRTENGTRFVNIGSVALPREDETHASYVIVDGGQVERRRVPYDHERVLAALRASGNPATDFLSQSY